MILGARFDGVLRIFWAFLCSKTHGLSFLNQMKIRASNTKSPIVYIIEADLHLAGAIFTLDYLESELSHLGSYHVQKFGNHKCLDIIVAADFTCWLWLLAKTTGFGCRLWL